MKRKRIEITRSSGQKEPLADGVALALSHFQAGEKAEHKENYDEAFKCYHAAAELGHAEAQCALGYCYYTGRGVPEDEVRAVEWYTKSARQGYAPAQHELGKLYFEYCNDQRMLYWFRHAAEQDHDGAQFELARCYSAGIGVEPDDACAVEWYAKAAEQGDAQKKNIGEAILLYCMAAEQGDANAQVKLGYLYYNGTGVEQDYKQATEWYRKAADQGYPEAQYNLACSYMEGLGVDRNVEKALHLLREAAEQGCAEAHFSLAEYAYYEHISEGPAHDEKKRAKNFLRTQEGKDMLGHYKAAMDDGNKDAKKRYKMLEKYL